MPCEYLKRDATICDGPGYKGGTLCFYHLRAIPYKLCEGGCGHVVSTKHSRPKCAKCSPGMQEAEFRAKKKFQAVPEDVSSPESPPLEVLMIDYVVKHLLPSYVA